ncbi:hypothetical protein E4T56_gene2735 [Termitomyces sp. T112]|nr:hypothetical protein E4T56_gene2735 [Termitomyces sp. T112]
MASGLSTNSLHLDMEIETTDTQQTHRVIALLNSRATGLFLDLEFIKHYGLTTQPLPKPIPVYNIDRTPNKAGTINSVINLVLYHWNHAEHAMFVVTSLDRQNMILGFMWLYEHNLKVDWAKGEIEADSSNFPTETVLSQQSLENEKWHPVAFYSKSLNAVEWNYEIHDKEMLAIIQLFEEWQHFLEGAWHKFKV